MSNNNSNEDPTKTTAHILRDFKGKCHTYLELLDIFEYRSQRYVSRKNNTAKTSLKMLAMNTKITLTLMVFVHNENEM